MNKLQVLSTLCFIALGSNLGNREQYLLDALKLIAANPQISDLTVSKYYETEPVSDIAQGIFINGAACFVTKMSALDLLHFLQSIEKKLGRVRTQVWGPRTIDLDLIFYGDVLIATPELSVPHPLAHKRRFVLEPLNDLAPNFIHPVLNKTIAELLSEHIAS